MHDDVPYAQPGHVPGPGPAVQLPEPPRRPERRPRHERRVAERPLAFRGEVVVEVGAVQVHVRQEDRQLEQPPPPAIAA